VYASHVLEHLDKSEARLFLKEAARILAPGGIIRLAVPDLQIYIDAYQVNSDADQFLSKLHFFPSERPSLLRRWVTTLTGNRTLHQWVYNGASLSRFLLNSGFVNQIQLSPGETLIPDPGDLNLHERSWDSLYIEAVKPSA
jgi:predicted SAM-dependent methyltransferase